MEEIYRSQFRMPQSLYESLKASADKNRRSVNAELVARLDESFSSEEPALALNEYETALMVLSRMYLETTERIEHLRASASLSPMDEIELRHEEATAKYLRQAAARASTPYDERPPLKKKYSRPLGIDTKHHLAAMTAINTPNPKPRK